MFHNFVVCDDYHKSALQKSRAFNDSIYYNGVRTALLSGKSVVMADIAWCKFERLDIVTKGLQELCKELKINPPIEFLYFENNPEACKRNAVHRGRKERVDREIEFIDKTSNNIAFQTRLFPYK